MNRPLLDFSKGDPLLPMKGLARHAFREAARDLHHYYLPSQAGDSRWELYRDIGNYFKDRGIPGKFGGRPPDVVATGGGTTEAYEIIIRLLAKDMKERAAITGEPIRPVIIMPVPTYGFFFNSPREWGFEIVTMPREKDGSLDAAKLKNLLADIEAQGKHAAAFYDSNPNNPLGRIRGRAETEALGQVMLEHVAAQRRRNDAVDDRTLDRMKQEGRSDKELMSLHAWWGPASRLRIIEDIVYDGLEYEGAEKPFLFAQVEENPWGSPGEHSFTIAGPSKAGLVNLRAGVIVSQGDGLYLRNAQLSTSYSSTDVALHALHAFFSGKESFATQKKKHLDHSNALYRFNGRFMKALIDGFPAVRHLSVREKSRMTTLLAKIDNIPKEEARHRLEKGIEGVTVATDPQAGFFHLLDFSALEGSLFTYKRPLYVFSNESVDEITSFKGCDGIKKAFGTAAIGLAYADWMGLDESEPLARVTFAVAPEMIVALANRLREVTETLTPAAPAQGAGVPGLSL